jgi:hypothetical protein
MIIDHDTLLSPAARPSPNHSNYQHLEINWIHKWFLVILQLDLS